LLTDLPPTLYPNCHVTKSLFFEDQQRNLSNILNVGSKSQETIYSASQSILNECYNAMINSKAIGVDTAYRKLNEQINGFKNGNLNPIIALAVAKTRRRATAKMRRICLPQHRDTCKGTQCPSNRSLFRFTLLITLWHRYWNMLPVVHRLLLTALP